MPLKLVYNFGGERADGSAEMKALLGGKGAGLAEMTNLGIPVPPGFTITTEVCNYYYRNGHTYPDSLQAEINEAVARISAVIAGVTAPEGSPDSADKAASQALAGAPKFGDAERPLLLSVRSGARVSMPGMMDTVLNLGMNDRTVEALAKQSGNPRFAWDSYRRFVQMFGDVVLGLKPESKHERDPLEVILEEHKQRRGVSRDHDLGAEDFAELVKAFKAEILKRTGKPFPDDPWEQLWMSIGAVFGSWQNKRAVDYRRIYRIPAEWGTAANVQAMVFGNMGEDSGTGVAFTRDPSTGARRPYGEYLVNAQGEDVVAGIRTPGRLSANDEGHGGDGQVSLERAMPEVYKELCTVFDRLERHFRDMQDIEFTVQSGKLWLLQTRNGKRTAQAMVATAVDMVAEGLIGEAEALGRIDSSRLGELLVPVIDERSAKKAREGGRLLAKGLAASRGAANGKVVFHADDAIEAAKGGDSVILVRWETSPEDVHGMHASAGIVTATGGMTSHAAVVARGMGKCCVVGAGSLQVDYAKQRLVANGKTIVAGDVITVDGTSGEVFQGTVLTLPQPPTPQLEQVLRFADKQRRLRIRANADTPEDAKRARAFGAEGIGLCRTEHMFFEPSRILAVREMIFASTTEAREQALGKILPMQRGDFIEILREMNGLPVTIRLLDPPLHEFLPTAKEEMATLAKAVGRKVEEVEHRLLALHETNPMLGHRGCRLAIAYPEIYRVQAAAVAEATKALWDEAGQAMDPRPEIMIPIVGHPRELEILRELVSAEVMRVLGPERAKKIPIGTMIELPRACLVAGSIAEAADFFSFGTNDLTQTALGISRDDASRFLPSYAETGIYTVDPFVELDRAGVGRLMRIAVEDGRGAKPDLKVGICGEHGGDPSSIDFCETLGLDYVSCSPFRIYTARVAAGQATLRKPDKRAS